MTTQNIRPGEVDKWLKANRIKVLDWRAHSPDSKIIENVWNIWIGRLVTYKTLRTGMYELWRRVQLEKTN
jgi:hypothetical protein